MKNTQEFDVSLLTEDEYGILATESNTIKEIMHHILDTNKTKYSLLWLHGMSKHMIPLDWNTKLDIAKLEVTKTFTWDHDVIIANDGKRTIDHKELYNKLTNYLRILFTMIIEMKYVAHFESIEDEVEKENIVNSLLANEVTDLYNNIYLEIDNEDFVYLTSVTAKHQLGEMLKDLIEVGEQAICDIWLTINNNSEINEIYGKVLAIALIMENSYGYKYRELLRSVKESIW